MAPPKLLLLHVVLTSSRIEMTVIHVNKAVAYIPINPNLAYTLSVLRKFVFRAHSMN